MKTIALDVVLFLSMVATQAAVTDADLAVSAPESRMQMIAGVPALLPVTITNNGPNTATGVTLQDALPFAAIVSATSSHGPVTCTSIGFEGFASYTCPVGTIPGGGSETIVFTVNSPWTGSFAHSLFASGAESDPNTLNNQLILPVNVLPATAAVPVMSPAVLALLGAAMAALALVALRR